MTVLQVKNTKADNRIQVRSTKLKPKLEYYAQVDRTSVSSIINKALEQYIAIREKNSKPRNPLAYWQGGGLSANSEAEFAKLTKYVEDSKTNINREYVFD